MSSFDPASTEFDEHLVGLSTDISLGALYLSAKAVREESDSLTVQTLSAMRNRLAALETRERALLGEAGSLLHLLGADALLGWQIVFLFCVLSSLHDVRLDLEDTKRAIARIAMPDSVSPSRVYTEDSFRAVIDDRLSQS